jgi:hypothetical protein
MSRLPLPPQSGRARPPATKRVLRQWRRQGALCLKIYSSLRVQSAHCPHSHKVRVRSPQSWLTQLAKPFFAAARLSGAATLSRAHVGSPSTVARRRVVIWH